MPAQRITTRSQRPRRLALARAALACVALLAGRSAHAGALRDIELTDGTKLRGEIVSVSEGTFRIRTEGLGEVAVPEDRVRSMSPAGGSGSGPQAPGSAAAPTSSADQASAATESVQRSITSNPAAFERIMALQDDPTVRDILADPALMRAIEAHDLEALARDPRVRALLDHPTVRELSRGADGH